VLSNRNVILATNYYLYTKYPCLYQKWRMCGCLDLLIFRITSWYVNSTILITQLFIAAISLQMCASVLTSSNAYTGLMFFFRLSMLHKVCFMIIDNTFANFQNSHQISQVRHATDPKFRLI
jgi:hypothetical protein